MKQTDKKTRKLAQRVGPVILGLGVLSIVWGALPKALDDRPRGNRPIPPESSGSLSKDSPGLQGSKIGTGPEWLEGYLPNFVLKTDDDKEVRFYDDLVKGKMVMINFMMTTCKGSCPGTTANLVKVQEALGDRVGRDIFMYSITLDPATDTPEVLRKYAESYHIKPGWRFLTGKGEEIEKLRRKLGLYDPDPEIDADKSQHAGLVVYGNAALFRWKTIPGLFKAQVIADAVLSLERPLGFQR